METPVSWSWFPRTIQPGSIQFLKTLLGTTRAETECKLLVGKGLARGRGCPATIQPGRLRFRKTMFGTSRLETDCKPLAGRGRCLDIPRMGAPRAMDVECPGPLSFFTASAARQQRHGSHCPFSRQQWRLWQGDTVAATALRRRHGYSLRHNKIVR